jgi:hypothetical protein
MYFLVYKRPNGLFTALLLYHDDIIVFDLILKQKLVIFPLKNIIFSAKIICFPSIYIKERRILNESLQEGLGLDSCGH